MRVGRILRQICRDCLPSVHTTRFAAIAAVVEAITAAGRLVPASVGRSIGGRTRPKHSIKRVDRLLGYPRVLAQRWVILASVARWLLRNVPRPIILVDWTKVTDGHWALWAAVGLLPPPPPLRDRGDPSGSRLSRGVAAPPPHLAAAWQTGAVIEGHRRPEDEDQHCRTRAAEENDSER